MQWIALLPGPNEDRLAWGWRCLRFTPRVAQVEEALLLEVSASQRLFGGRRNLLRRLLGAQGTQGVPVQGHATQGPPEATAISIAYGTTQRVLWAQAPTALQALAALRLLASGEPLPHPPPDALPLWTLRAVALHAATLERTGCRTWGEFRSLPRAGVARRFGPEVLQALDAAYGQRPERYPWLTLPDQFDQRLELPEQATTADELLWSAQRLLTLMQSWLRAANRGVLALELEWVHGLRRLDGKAVPATDRIELRTAEPTQDVKHLRRLASEQLARTAMQAPATDLRLRSLQTVPWGGRTVSLLPEDQRKGERLHELVERLSVRLGPANVTRPLARQDHRPERMQEWVAAQVTSTAPPVGEPHADDLLPGWLLSEPLRLAVRADRPWYQGPLQLLSRARRLEAGWWDGPGGQPALRDYFIARGESVGLLWVYRERLAADQDQPRWFLHGIYA